MLKAHFDCQCAPVLVMSVAGIQPAPPPTAYVVSGMDLVLHTHRQLQKTLFFLRLLFPTSS